MEKKLLLAAALSLAVLLLWEKLVPKPAAPPANPVQTAAAAPTKAPEAAPSPEPPRTLPAPGAASPGAQALFPRVRDRRRPDAQGRGGPLRGRARVGPRSAFHLRRREGGDHQADPARGRLSLRRQGLGDRPRLHAVCGQRPL